MKKSTKFVLIVACIFLILFIGYKDKKISFGKQSILLNTSTIKLNTSAIQSFVKAQNVSPSPGIQYFFTKANQNPDQELIKVINSSNASLDIAIYSITKKDIVSAIANAKKRGAAIRIITDKECSQNKLQEAELSFLKRNGIPIKVNTHSGLMHMKVTIADNKVVTTGSFNYTQAASTINDEVLIIINNPKTAGDFTKQFNSMWNNNADFTQY